MGDHDGEGAHSTGCISYRRQLVTFYVKSGAESVGVVDMLAIRKDHSKPMGAATRGDALQIIPIQVKDGPAARPTLQDAARLRRSDQCCFRLCCH